MPNRKKPKKPTRLGIFLSRLPAVRGLYPLYLARQLYLNACELALPSLPDAISGLRIAYASDIHYGRYLEKARLIDLAEKLNALDADLMILGGDYGEDSEHSLAFWREIPDLRARLGVFAVPGNHDLTDLTAQQLGKAMGKRGVIPLINSVQRLSHRGARFALCSTDDVYEGHPEPEKVAHQAAGAGFVIYAPHSPDALKAAYALSEKPFFDLALCGHTHGGQVALFGVGLATSSHMGLRYGAHYRSGVIREKGVTVFVSNGVGTTWLPLRLGVEPQYHLITLRKAADAHEKG